MRKNLLLLLLLVTLTTNAQSEQEALKKAKEAIALVDKGKFDESIPLLEAAQKLAPDDVNYPYELAYVYYSKKNYPKAITYLEKLVTHKDVSDRVFQLLGNSYDNLDKSEQAVAIYTAGLKSFPRSGNLYLEMGVLNLRKKEYIKALSYFEKGIEVAPSFSSNYYWASKIYCSSSEEVWGMLYGEIFMNLERNSQRTAEISRLLYNTYKNEIRFSDNSSISVSFSKEGALQKDGSLPFGMGVYEQTLITALLEAGTEINLNTLHKIRSTFIDLYFKNGHDEKYPNVLFRYQKQVKDAGHMEAYNYWILMKGDENGFKEWMTVNKNKWENFTKWFTDNGMKIGQSNQFYKAQYSR
ncbi:tetratricopeptide repeat protein [Niabella beijingensis]|uniref:tetratricopeptide repeat protein n=1 Tax=Niabella beijingensis TaxID=2872700 RepID=UPI001CBE0AE2|nr:tetratricopeptide repeat protein [Niabella beijingensis]MBZ4188587.1 tetratricopeptide repeat protein [Niabella beijingensis]